MAILLNCQSVRQQVKTEMPTFPKQINSYQLTSVPTGISINYFKILHLYYVNFITAI